jgi:hypothetical protein
MAQTNYERGRAREYATRNKLYKLGAAYVMRAAQSKGAVDLLALWPKIHIEDGFLFWQRPPWLIQVKSGSGSMSKAEKQTLKDLAEETGNLAILARTKKSGRGIEFIDLATNQEVGVESGSGSHRALPEDPAGEAGGSQED